MSISVLIVDDDPAARGGLKAILEAAGDIVVVGEAENAAEAVSLAARLRPVVTLMDIVMPDVDGVEATRRLVRAGLRTRVLVVTMRSEDERLPYDALRAGASGFLLKKSAPALLVAGVRVVAGGESLIDPAVTSRIIRRFLPTGPKSDRLNELAETLTPREREVLLLVGRGLSNEEIAASIWLGRATVKSHVSSLLKKLDQRDRAQLVIFAYEAGLLPEDPGLRLQADPSPDDSRPKAVDGADGD